MHVVIIGGGAAGMAAAIAAAKRGHCATVLERGRKTLKKLGVTGNGRGNLLNCGEPKYFGEAEFAKAKKASSSRQVRFACLVLPKQAIFAFLREMFFADKAIHAYGSNFEHL